MIMVVSVFRVLETNYIAEITKGSSSVQQTNICQNSCSFQLTSGCYCRVEMTTLNMHVLPTVLLMILDYDLLTDAFSDMICLEIPP